jgi:hypothetical protein
MATDFSPQEQKQLEEFYALRKFKIEFLPDKIQLTKNGRVQTITNEEVKQVLKIFTKN